MNLNIDDQMNSKLEEIIDVSSSKDNLLLNQENEKEFYE